MIKAGTMPDITEKGNPAKIYCKTEISWFIFFSSYGYHVKNFLRRYEEKVKLGRKQCTKKTSYPYA